MTPIRPINDNIVVDMTSTDVMDVSNNIIQISSLVKQNPSKGRVIAVGPGKTVKGKLVPPVLNVGDTVLFPKGTGQIVKVDKQHFLMMSEGAITGTITE